MHEPAWKGLVDRLKREGFESSYLERLDARLAGFASTRGRQSVELEILAEMAAALGRSEDKVNVALLELQVAAREHARAGTGDERRRWAAEHARRRERAERALWELMVHREAIGVYHHEDLELFYPLPPALEDDPSSRHPAP